MYRCEVCNAWMQDNKVIRANHERGAKHVALLEKSASLLGAAPLYPSPANARPRAAAAARLRSHAEPLPATA